MKTTLYFINWNDSFYLPFIKKHYSHFCHRIVMYDNYSTDNSREIAKNLGFEVVLFGKEGELNDKEYLEVKNNCWKNNTDDWVIVCDADEFLWHPYILNFLVAAKIEKKTIINTKGFNIFSQYLPKEDIMEIKKGLQDNNYSKRVIFNPKEITEINYVYGCHVSNPTGNIKYYYADFTLFHYRNIGGPQRLIDRHAIYRDRMSEINKRLGLGIHYRQTDEQRLKDWQESYNKSQEFDCFNN